MTSTIPPYFDEHRPLIEIALRRSGGTHAVEDVLHVLQTDDRAFWLATPRSFVMAEVVQYPQRRVINWSVAGGEREELLGFERALTAFALRLGCQDAQVYGRRGWERVLTDYRKAGVILRKSLTGGSIHG